MALKVKLRNENQYVDGVDPGEACITYDDIQRAMDSKFQPDQAMRKQLQYLASYGYIIQQEIDGTIYITLL